jgi:enoyl-CoA hydratase
MLGELSAMLDTAANQSKLVIFKSVGEHFCLGREAMGQVAPATEAYVMRDRIDVILGLYDAFRRSKIPVIGVIQGKAAGLGCAIAALCDITVASDAARFQLPEMAHQIMPTLAMSALIDRVPLKALTYLVYSTEEIDAQRALAFGLASEVVAPARLESAVGQLVERLKKYSRVALTGVKEYTRSAYAMDISAANDFARNLHATLNSSSAIRS